MKNILLATLLLSLVATSSIAAVQTGTVTAANITMSLGPTYSVEMSAAHDLSAHIGDRLIICDTNSTGRCWGAFVGAVISGTTYGLYSDYARTTPGIIGKDSAFNASDTSFSYRLVPPNTATHANRTVKSIAGRVGPTALSAGDDAILAKYDYIFLNRSLYDDLSGNIIDQAHALNVSEGMGHTTEFFTYQYGTGIRDDYDALSARDINNLARYDVSRGHSQGTVNGDNTGFFLTKTGARISFQGDANKWFLNPNATGFASYWNEAVQADIASRKWSDAGYFIDDMLVDLTLGSWNYNFTDQYTTNDAWLVGMYALMQNVTAQAHAIDQKVWTNSGGTYTAAGKAAWLAIDLLTTPPDFMIDEAAFAVNYGAGDVQWWSETAWKRQIDTMAAMANVQTGWYASTNLRPTTNCAVSPYCRDSGGVDVTFQQILFYSLGSYLLGRTDLTSFSFAYPTLDHGTNVTSLLYWLDEYELDIGTPTAAYSIEPHGATNIYKRPYSKGYVYVNPTATTVSGITLPYAMHKLDHDTVKTPGTATSVTSIDLPPHTAEILFRATAAEVTPVPTPSGDVTPSYTFSSTGAGAVTYGGSCGTTTDLPTASIGNNTVTWTLANTGAATYSDCTVTVAGGNTLAVTPFSITAPTVSITAPSPNRAIVGTETVTATCSYAGGVEGVTFYWKGNAIAAEDTSSPYSISWDSTDYPNATGSLTAACRGTGGSITTSAPISVTISNPEGTGPMRLAGPGGVPYVVKVGSNTYTMSAGSSVPAVTWQGASTTWQGASVTW